MATVTVDWIWITERMAVDSLLPADGPERERLLARPRYFVATESAQERISRDDYVSGCLKGLGYGRVIVRETRKEVMERAEELVRGGARVTVFVG